mmetsp:Transcript_143610/g.364499  ORF Transcript_143610/g.364499 Transcript_143610/m.364499 type:complete len:271 (-) Transcript_143610:146-958(-)
MLGYISVTVLPPLVGKLEDKATDAYASGNRAVFHDLLSQISRCLRLRLQVLRVGSRIPCIGAVLTQEQWLACETRIDIEHVAEAFAVVFVDAPDIDVDEARCGVLQPPQPSVDAGHGVNGVVLLDEGSCFLQHGHRLPKAQALVEAVVVPLIPNGPHQDSWMVLHSVDLADDAGGSKACIAIDTVQHPDAASPECVQHRRVIDGLVRAHRIDARTRHDVRIPFDVSCEVKTAGVRTSFVDRVPGHALQVHRHAIHQHLAPLHFDLPLNPW